MGPIERGRRSEPQKVLAGTVMQEGLALEVEILDRLLPAQSPHTAGRIRLSNLNRIKKAPDNVRDLSMVTPAGFEPALPP